MPPFELQLSLGLDSAVCCAALGALGPLETRWLRLALLFGLCDIVASIAGSFWWQSLSAPPELAVYLCFASSLGLAARFFPDLIWAAPMLLSLDNLASPGTLPEAIADGLVSAFLALGGIGTGLVLRRLLWPRGIASSLQRR